MRGQIPAIFCDGLDGRTLRRDEWAADHYEATASSVGGVRITASERAPGWVSIDTTDYCPACVAREQETS